MKPNIGTETVRLSDWSGLTDFGGTGEVYAPRTEQEIVSLVRFCADSGRKLRAIGLRTSWNALWHTNEVMMSTAKLDGVVSIDRENYTITCLPGTTLETLHAALWENGLTLPTAPAVDWVTVAGAISTGSHGSGPASIASSMIACRLVTANGEVLQLHEGEEMFDAVRISMGALGVLSSVTLRVVPAFWVHLRRTRITENEWARYLVEGEMSYVQWFPQTGLSCLIRVDVLKTKAEADAREANLKLHGFDVNDAEQFAKYGQDFVDAANAVIQASNRIPSLFAARNRFIMDLFFQDDEKVGPAHKVLMSYKSAPVAGSEWAVPVERFPEAFDEMKEMVSGGKYFLPIVWLKKVQGETAWLRAADGPAVQCGIYHSLVGDSPDHARDMVYKIERMMLKYGGRPHLGKLISLDPGDFRRVYSNWDQFNALRHKLDPKGMFWSETMAQSFGS